MDKAGSAIASESPCQACGACCSYSQNWPRFTTEDDADLDLIPEKFVNDRCRECAATAIAVRRCQARSARRRPAPSMRCGPRYAGPACPAISNARWRENGTGWRCWCNNTHRCRPGDAGTHTPRPDCWKRKITTSVETISAGGYGSRCAFASTARTTCGETYAVTASARSSSSRSSIGAKVESGLVESVIGLRLP